MSVDCGLIVLKKFNFVPMFLGMREMDPYFPAVKPVLVDFIEPGVIIKAKCRNIFMEYILPIKIKI